MGAVILPKVRDPRFITVRRGGSLRDDDHHLLAVWAADCAEHVLHHFEQARPGDDRPRRAIELGARLGAGRDPVGRGSHGGRPRQRRGPGPAWGSERMPRTLPARPRRWATWRPTSSVPRPTRSGPPARPSPEGDDAGRLECEWQRARLPDEIRELVLDDQRLRNELCWFAFDC